MKPSRAAVRLCASCGGPRGPPGICLTERSAITAESSTPIKKIRPGTPSSAPAWMKLLCATPHLAPLPLDSRSRASWKSVPSATEKLPKPTPATGNWHMYPSPRCQTWIRPYASDTL